MVLIKIVTNMLGSPSCRLVGMMKASKSILCLFNKTFVEDATLWQNLLISQIRGYILTVFIGQNPC